MFLSLWFWLKKVSRRIRQIIKFSGPISNINYSQNTIDIVNDKIKNLTGTSQNKIDINAYEKYFSFLEKLGLSEEFSIKTTQDNLNLSGLSIKPIFTNKNNNKIVIFCHGVTNNKWTLFYCAHLALQIGYQVIIYDARNHGLSDRSYTSLGQIEASDLQDVIEHVRQKYHPEKIGLYGFSMGASTLLFWTSYFAGGDNPEVTFAICEAPFDNFSEQLKRLLGSGLNYYWKEIMLRKMVQKVLHSSYAELEKVNPILVLPQELPIKLMLLHGLKDIVISWQSSFNLWYQLNKNNLNKNKINLYLCCYADHGELPFIADYVPHSLRWKNRRQFSQLNFTTLFCNSLEKNL